MTTMDPRHPEFETPYGDHDSPLGPVVTASPEEIRLADELRRRLRELYARRRAAAPLLACIGAD
jgi:hypothetical protein